MSDKSDATDALFIRCLAVVLLLLGSALAAIAVCGVYDTFVLDPQRVRAMQTAAEKGHLVTTKEAK